MHNATCYKLHVTRSGISIVEIIIYLAIFTLVAVMGIIALNPGGQLAKSRNTQRELHLQAVMNSIRQNIADQGGGSFSCSSGLIPTSTKKMATGSGNYNIGPCLVPIYLSNLPYDPKATSSHWVSIADYDTGYNILKNATTGEITVSAPSAELGKTISITR